MYGNEHIAEREMDRSILMELNRRCEILYTPDVIHMASEAMVRNFIDLVEEGVRRMLRATRKVGDLDLWLIILYCVARTDRPLGFFAIASISCPILLFG